MTDPSPTPAPPLEPRGCPLPGACSCPTAPIVPPDLIRALEVAEAALADIGDAEREPGDDLAWAERRAAEELPRIRRVLELWGDHATPPPSPDWRALCRELRDAYAESREIQYGPWVGCDHGPSPLLARADAALATPPAATREDWTRVSIRTAFPLRQATPPAATREAEHDDGDDVIDRWVDSKSNQISNWAAPRSDIAALIGEALEHWGRSATREAGPLPQAGNEGPTKAELFQVLMQSGGETRAVSVKWLEPFARAVLARWGGAAVQPVPLDDRPWERPGWCDEEGRCWVRGKVEREWRLMFPLNSGVPKLRYCFDFSLPHWALPVPAAAEGEGQP